MLIVQSIYDAWSVEYIIGTKCHITKNDAPYSLEKCNSTTRQAIDDYSRKSRAAIKQMVKIKPNTGAWSPSCVQHGFTFIPSVRDSHYKVPGLVGTTLYDAIEEFLANPENPPVYID